MSESLAVASGIILLVIFVAWGIWYGAGVEAAAYNRMTGRDLTQWEALWVNARIDCN